MEILKLQMEQTRRNVVLRRLAFFLASLMSVTF